MAICRIYNTRGQEVAKVEYQGSPLPPDTEATVFSSSGNVIGSIKSRHAERKGDIYDSGERLVGSTDGFAPYGESECWAENSSKQTIGLVKNGSEISKKVGGDFSMVGTIQSDGWTAADKEGLRRVAAIMGRGVTPQLENLMQIKQRSLAGVAALLLAQL